MVELFKTFRLYFRKIALRTLCPWEILICRLFVALFLRWYWDVSFLSSECMSRVILLFTTFCLLHEYIDITWIESRGLFIILKTRAPLSVVHYGVDTFHTATSSSRARTFTRIYCITCLQVFICMYLVFKGLLQDVSWWQHDLKSHFYELSYIALIINWRTFVCLSVHLYSSTDSHSRLKSMVVEFALRWRHICSYHNAASTDRKVSSRQDSWAMDYI